MEKSVPVIGQNNSWSVWLKVEVRMVQKGYCGHTWRKSSVKETSTSTIAISRSVGRTQGTCTYIPASPTHDEMWSVPTVCTSFWSGRFEWQVQITDYHQMSTRGEGKNKHLRVPFPEPPCTAGLAIEFSHFPLRSCLLFFLKGPRVCRSHQMSSRTRGKQMVPYTPGSGRELLAILTRHSGARGLHIWVTTRDVLWRKLGFVPEFIL